jgi:hypothetical protein
LHCRRKWRARERERERERERGRERERRVEQVGDLCERAVPFLRRSAAPQEQGRRRRRRRRRRRKRGEDRFAVRIKLGKAKGHRKEAGKRQERGNDGISELRCRERGRERPQSRC